MAVAYDTYTNLASGTGTRSWSHAGAASGVNGVIVVIAGGGTDETTAVTYNGLALTRSQTGDNATGETGTVSVWFLGEGVPSGTNTVQVTRSGSTNAYIATVFTVTAGRITEVVTGDSGSSNNASTDTLSLTIPSGFVVAMFGGLYCGENALTSITSSADIGGGTPGGVNSVDFGNFTSVINYRTAGIYTGSGAAYADFGWTWSSDDGAWAAIAVREAPIYKLASAAATVTVTAAAVSGSMTKSTTAATTVAPTTAAVPAAITKRSTASATVTVTAAAAGAKMHTATATATVTVTASAQSSRTMQEAATGVTVDVVAVAYGYASGVTPPVATEAWGGIPILAD